ncbi:MAG TPA: hypothetical protein HA254_04070 [Candidatus Diapherotrites archaeon]|uniref:Uncharacterized protein n=1 Tax=Candidatus Iainarchaeum sp. TaxID=3101447 RepID=A0A7J4IWC5_9ARCH|nr:hypothetical protein [Candidatus Diapherotrites archaeon]
MVIISSAGNTAAPAYLVLKSKGYELFRDASNPNLWIAQKGKNKFIAESTVELLGLILIYESRGENWMANDKEIEEFLSK